MRNAEENRETAGVGTFPDAGAAEEDPLDTPPLGIRTGRQGLGLEFSGGGGGRRGERPPDGEHGGGGSEEAGHGRHWWRWRRGFGRRRRSEMEGKIRERG